MQAFAAAWGDRAAFFVVYIAEAHAVDGWHLPANEAAGILVRQPTTADERATAARRCRDALGLDLPTLVDGMDDAVCMAYAAWPDRIYVVGADGTIAYKGGPGPMGFRVPEAAAALARVLGPAVDQAAGSAADTGARAVLPTFRVLRGSVAQPQQAVAEMEDVVEAWQEADGRVYLRTLFGEERTLPGYLGAVDVSSGRLLLVDTPGTALVPPSRRVAQQIAAACPV